MKVFGTKCIKVLKKTILIFLYRLLYQGFPVDFFFLQFSECSVQTRASLQFLLTLASRPWFITLYSLVAVTTDPGDPEGLIITAKRQRSGGVITRIKIIHENEHWVCPQVIMQLLRTVCVCAGTILTISMRYSIITPPCGPKLYCYSVHGWVLKLSILGRWSDFFFFSKWKKRGHLSFSITYCSVITVQLSFIDCD